MHLIEKTTTTIFPLILPKKRIFLFYFRVFRYVFDKNFLCFVLFKRGVRDDVRVMTDGRGYLTPSEIQRLTDSARNIRDKALIRFMAVTGARVSEAISVRVDDIDKAGYVRIRTLKKRVESFRTVPLDDYTVDLLGRYIRRAKLRKGDVLFPITRQNVYHILQKTGKVAGITHVGGKRLHPHHFRHSLAVAWVKADDSVDSVRKLQMVLGHKKFSTTAQYLVFATSELKEAHRRVLEEAGL